MKQLKLVFLFAVAVTASIAANAQEKGDMAVGGNIVTGTGEGYSRGGIGAKFLYNASNRIRLVAGFEYFDREEYMKFHTMNLYVHLLPRRDRDVKIYPFIGIGRGSKLYDPASEKNIANIAPLYGCGIDCKLSDKLMLNTELRAEQGRALFFDGTLNLALGLVYKL